MNEAGKRGVVVTSCNKNQAQHINIGTTKPLKILVLNDDSLGATTVQDKVLNQGFTLLSRAVTKKVYQHHVKYNSLLNEGFALGEQIYLEPSDLTSPKVHLAAELQQLAPWGNQPHQATRATGGETPLSAQEQELSDYILFFTLDEQTNIDNAFIAQNFDGIFFFLHHPLGSKVLPKSLLSLLANRQELALWVFNLRFEPQYLLDALHYATQQVDASLLQRMQSPEFKQMQSFMQKLLPQAEYIGCADQASYQALHSIYASNAGQEYQAVLAKLHLSYNAYQHWHYLNHIKSLCNTAVGLSTQLKQQCVLSPLPEAEAASQANAQHMRMASMGGALGALGAGAVTLKHFPQEVLVEMSEPGQAPDSATATAQEQSPVHVVLSSSNFKCHPVLGLELSGVRLILQILATFPQADLSLVLNKGLYSWLESVPEEAILWQDLADPFTRGELEEQAKSSQELLGAPVQRAVLQSLRVHLLASLQDPEQWPWTAEQRAALEQVAQRLNQPTESRVYCYQSLTDAVLQQPISLVCSDIQADLVCARCKGLATVELIEDLKFNQLNFNLLQSKGYFDGLIEHSEDMQADFLRMALPQLLAAAPMLEKNAAQKALQAQYLQSELQAQLAALPQPAAANSLNAENAESADLLGQFGLALGFKLLWSDVLRDLNWQQHVQLKGGLSEHIDRIYQGHTQLLQALFKTLGPLLQAKQAAQQQAAATVKLAQLSNYTFAKRYEVHYLALRFFTQLAHAQGFGDGATLAQKFGQCDFSEAYLKYYESLRSQAANGEVQAALSSLLKQDLQWPVFKPLSLSVLSFGCSRGDEIYDLLPLFNGQRLTGIDINESAIAFAQQSLRGMQHVPLDQAKAEFTKLYQLPQQVLASEEIEPELDRVQERLKQLMPATGPENPESMAQPQLVKYLGAMGLINFVSTNEFFKLYQDQPWPQYDVITVMTVLCRHPDTMHKSSAQGIYDFSEFNETLMVLDKLLKKGGMLCLFNSNYRLEDTELAQRYVGVFPQDFRGLQIDLQKQIGLAGDPRVADEDLGALAQRYLAGPAAEAAAEPSLEGEALPKPAQLRECLSKSDPLSLYGNVALFNRQGANVQSRINCKSIYFKLSD